MPHIPYACFLCKGPRTYIDQTNQNYLFEATHCAYGI